MNNICARMITLFWLLILWEYMFESLCDGLLQTFIWLLIIMLDYYYYEYTIQGGNNNLKN